MAAADGAERGHLVTLRDGVVHDDLHVGEGVAEALVEDAEVGGAAQLAAGRALQPVRDAVGGEHLVNRLGPPLVPDLLEPAADDLFIFL
jgi:hypothetical protein